MKKRIFSAALAGCMMLTMVPVTAFAAEEGVTEVAVEQYAAEERATIQKVAPLAPSTEWSFGSVDSSFDTASKFYTPDGTKLKLVYFKKFNEAIVAEQAGYYLPLMIAVPGATDATQVVLIEAHSDPENGTIIKRDKTLNVKSPTVDRVGEDGTRYIYDLLQVATMEGVMSSDKTIQMEVWMKGTAGQETYDYVVDFDYSDVVLADNAKYKDAKLDIYRDSNDPTLFGKKLSALYNSRTQTANFVSGYTDFSSKEEERSGYYLPLILEFDACENAVAVVQNGVDSTGKTLTKKITAKNPAADGYTYDSDFASGKLILVQRIAKTDGTKLRKEVEVTLYPQGEGVGAPSKTYTFDLTNIKLQNGLVVGAVPVEKDAVKNLAQADTLAIQRNLEQVQSVVLKDGVLTVTANVGSAVQYKGAGSTNSSATAKEIPVLFTMEVDGKSVTGATSVANYGGTDGKHVLKWVDLGKAEDEITLTANAPAYSGLSDKVKVKVVDASAVPVMNDGATVAGAKVEVGEVTGVEGNVLMGLEAADTASTAAEIKDLYTENNGTVTITDAIGRPLDDDAAVGTGSMIVLRDVDGEIVDRITIVVKGDVRGNGVMGLGQLVAAAQAVKGTASLTGPYLAAGDFNGDGAISLGDLVGMAALLK